MPGQGRLPGALHFKLLGQSCRNFALHFGLPRTLKELRGPSQTTQATILCLLTLTGFQQSILQPQLGRFALRFVQFGFSWFSALSQPVWHRLFSSDLNSGHFVCLVHSSSWVAASAAFRSTTSPIALTPVAFWDLAFHLIAVWFKSFAL